MGSEQPKPVPNSGIAAAESGRYAARMDMNQAVAKAIGAERTIASMTVRELAAAAGIPERSLMRILTAERDIKVNQVAELAAALRVYPHELIAAAEQILARSERPAADVLQLRRPVSAPTDHEVRELRAVADDAPDWEAEDEAREEQP
jgi:transcriptional regulator with XRE-family HTH domain